MTKYEKIPCIGKNRSYNNLAMNLTTMYTNLKFKHLDIDSDAEL